MITPTALSIWISICDAPPLTLADGNSLLNI